MLPELVKSVDNSTESSAQCTNLVELPENNPSRPDGPCQSRGEDYIDVIPVRRAFENRKVQPDIDSAFKRPLPPFQE